MRLTPNALTVIGLVVCTGSAVLIGLGQLLAGGILLLLASGFDILDGALARVSGAEYRYGAFQAFYDSGAVWDRNDAAVLRHSAGVGLRQGVFSLAVAFPLREGHIDPIFMLGMNY